jgi:hypothetical protein
MESWATMTRGISARQQHEDRLRLRRKQRDQVASALVLGSEKPVKATPIASKPKRPSAGLRGVAPISRKDK